MSEVRLEFSLLCPLDALVSFAPNILTEEYLW